MSAHRILELRFQGLGCSPIKERYASWVQNVVRQFSPLSIRTRQSLIGAVSSAGDPRMDGPLVDLLYYQMHSRVAEVWKGINAEGI